MGVNSPGLAAGLDRAVETLNDWLAELDVGDPDGPSSEVLGAIETVLRHARATTPGDDRGRELADDPRVRSLIAGAVDQAWRAGATGELGDTADRTDAVLRGLRALAAPAETEAGDPPEAGPATLYDAVLSALNVLADDLPGEPPVILAWDPATLAGRVTDLVEKSGLLAAPAETEAADDGAAARYALATLIDEIGAEVGVAPGQPTLVLTQVRDWMENARRTNVENERLRAASPPAQGPAETLPRRRRIGGLDGPTPDGTEDQWPDTFAGLAEAAHGLIANVDGSAQGWEQDDDWVEAADRWCARYDRVIAAPAETEAGDPPELWWHPVHSVITPTAVDGHDYGWYVLEQRTWLDERPDGALRLAAAPPAPEGEADWSGVVPADRERLVGAVTSVLQRSTGSLVEDVASDLLDNLASGGYRVVTGWLPGERDEPGGGG